MYKDHYHHNYRAPVPGWIDSLSAAGGIYAAFGFGYLKFVPGKRSMDHLSLISW